MTTVALYARLSKDRYKGEVQEGIKVEQQLAECRAWASSRGWTISAEFSDNDISATTGKRRPGFEALLSHIHDGEADAIVCWHTDRLARLTKDLERVIDLDIPVHGLHAGHLDLSTPAGRAGGGLPGDVERVTSSKFDKIFYASDLGKRSRRSPF